MPSKTSSLVKEKQVEQRNVMTEAVTILLALRVGKELASYAEKALISLKKNRGLLLADGLRENLFKLSYASGLLLAKDIWETVGDQYGWTNTETITGMEGVNVTPILTGSMSSTNNPDFDSSDVPLAVHSKNRELSYTHANNFVSFIDKKFQTLIEVMAADEVVDRITPEVMSHADKYAKTTSSVTSYWANNNSAMSRMSHEGVQYFRWYTTLDEKRCTFCKGMHGKVIVKGEPFARRGEVIQGVGANNQPVERYMNALPWDIYHPGLHPWCRCGLDPIL